jgi:hypothetical protein
MHVHKVWIFAKIVVDGKLMQKTSLTGLTREGALQEAKTTISIGQLCWRNRRTYIRKRV